MRRPLTSTSVLTALRPRSATLAEPSLPRPAVSLADAEATGMSRISSPMLVVPVASISSRPKMVSGCRPGEVGAGQAGSGDDDFGRPLRRPMALAEHGQQSRTPSVRLRVTDAILEYVIENPLLLSASAFPDRDPIFDVLIPYTIYFKRSPYGCKKCRLGDGMLKGAGAEHLLPVRDGAAVSGMDRSALSAPVTLSLDARLCRRP